MGLTQIHDPVMFAIPVFVVFVLLESRNSSAILPMRILQDRNRAGAYIVGLLVGTGLFAVFLFLHVMGAIIASQAETASNPRSRSARLRAWRSAA